MKKLVLFIAVTAFTFLHSYSQKEINYEIIEGDDYAERTLPMPDGTKIFENSDGTTTVKLPDGYVYIMKQVGSDEIITMVSGRVTCVCTNGSGCHPCAKGKRFGCMMLDCKSCNKSSITNPNGEIEKEYEILGISNDDESTIRFLSSKKLSNGLGPFLKTNDIPYFSNFEPNILKYKSAQETINYYLENTFSKEDVELIKNNKMPSVEVEYCLVDFFGNTIALITPKSKLTGDEITIRSGGWKCTCNIAGGSCPDASEIIFNACDANNCKNCTGSKIIKNNTGGLELAH